MIGLVDYGMGNLQSVRNACEFLGFAVKLVRSAAELDQAEKIILPGVGAFSEGMKNLNAQDLAAPLCRAVRENHKPLLGICLGMQLLADRGTEGGDTPGLGLIPGTVKRLETGGLRLPHIGWNDIRIVRPTPVFLPDLAVDYYFVHSYFFAADDTADVVARTEYGIDFPCVVGRGSALGVQFHPEKSHRFGLELLKRFLGSC